MTNTPANKCWQWTTYTISSPALIARPNAQYLDSLMGLMSLNISEGFLWILDFEGSKLMDWSHC